MSNLFDFVDTFSDHVQVVDISRRATFERKTAMESHSPEKPYNNLPKLPPRNDVETTRVLRKLSIASRALAELKGIAQTIPNQSILINSLTLQEAKASSEIENIVTTNDALYKAFSVSSSQIDPHTKEVLRYREAMAHGLRLMQKRGLLTTNIFEEVVKKITLNEEGIRRVPGTTVRNARTGDPVYTPPEGERLIRDLLANLETYIHSEHSTDPLLKLAVIHYQFEAIHPFGDGNGRVGRILNSLYLVHQGLLEQPILYLSRYIIDNRPTYYTLLRGVTESSAWEDWILYMLEAIEQTAVVTRNRIQAIRELLEELTSEANAKLPGRVYSKELMELLFQQPYTKTQFLVDAGIAERKTATQYLRELEKAGILRSEKVGKEVLFLNHRLMELLSQ